MICLGVQVPYSHARIRSSLGFSDTIPCVSFGDSILRGAALVLLLGSCAQPTEVELRLFPCGFAGALPVSVDLEMQGYDAGGTALAPLTASFAVAAGVLDDGYATVGLRRPPGVSTADFTLTWRDAGGSAQVVMHAGLAVPKVGEVLELGAEMCVPPDSSSSSGTSTGEGTSASSTSTSTSSTSSTSTSTGVVTDSSTGTSTGESTSTSTSTGEGTSTTGEPSILGDDCNMVDEQFYCEGGGPGQLGTLLECVGLVWTKADLQKRCDLAAYCPAELNQVDPVAVGCSGVGLSDWACVCQDKLPLPCIGDVAGCGGSTRITLCVEDEMGVPIQTKGVCAPMCVDADINGPMCTGA